MALQMSRGRATVNARHGAASIPTVRGPVVLRTITLQTASANSIRCIPGACRVSTIQYVQARSSRAPSRVAGATQMEPLAPEPEEEDFDLLSDKIAVLQTQVGAA